MTNRRRFLRNTALAGAALATPALQATRPVRRMIDCHTHFYDPTRPEGMPWQGKETPLYRRVLPDDRMEVARPHQITDTVVVEASPWVEDNQFRLDLAAKDKRLLGIIGNLDPVSIEFAANVRRFAANPLYRGIRISSARSADPANAAARDAGLKLLAASGLVLDINRGPATPGISAALAENHPDLTVTINHCGNPGDAAKPLPDEWKSGITDGAARKNVFIKVSALVEGVKGEPGTAPTDPEYDRPVSDPIWNAFGPDRLIYGSNWPVSDRGAPHGTVVGIVEAYFDEKGADVSNKFFAGNSRVAYRWQERA